MILKNRFLTSILSFTLAAASMAIDPKTFDLRPEWIGENLSLAEQEARGLKTELSDVIYLDPEKSSRFYKVSVIDGRLCYSNGRAVNFNKDNKSRIWVIDESGNLYISYGSEYRRNFRHSSFVAGGKVLAAGEIAVLNGVVHAISNTSGHYWPTPESLSHFSSWLEKSKAHPAQPILIGHNVTGPFMHKMTNFGWAEALRWKHARQGSCSDHVL